MYTLIAISRPPYYLQSTLTFFKCARNLRGQLVHNTIPPTIPPLLVPSPSQGYTTTHVRSFSITLPSRDSIFTIRHTFPCTSYSIFYCIKYNLNYILAKQAIGLPTISPSTYVMSSHEIIPPRSVIPAHQATVFPMYLNFDFLSTVDPQITDSSLYTHLFPSGHNIICSPCPHRPQSNSYYSPLFVYYSFLIQFLFYIILFLI